MSASRKRWLLGAKAVVSLSLLGWLGARMLERDGVELLVARLGALDPRWIAAAIALHFAAVLAGVARWRLLLRALHVELPVAFLARSFLIGRFVGAFTPSTTGLDGWRLFEAGRASGSMARSGTAIVVEKLVGLIGMATVCAALVPFGGVELLGPGSLGVAGGLGVGALFGLALLARPTWLEALALRLPLRVRGRGEKAALALRESRLGAGSLSRAVILGVVSHLALSAVFLATARALGVDLPIATLLVVGNAIVLAVLLPISVGGVGVREGVAVLLLAGAGVTSTDATLVALLGYLTGQIPAVLGGVLMLLSKRAAPPSPVPEPAPAE